MFDLFRSREKAVRYLLTALLALVGLSMVTYLIPGSGQQYDSGPGNTQVLAKIGNSELTSQEVSKAISNMTRQRQMPAELLSIYVPQIVQQMITERALAYEAERLGMKVSEEEAEDSIIDQLPPDVVKNGKVDAQLVTAVLQQQGITMNQLRDDTSRGLLVARLRQMIAGSIVVSTAEIEKEYHRRNDKIKLQYVLISSDKYKTEAEPTDTEIQAYYNAHKSEFMEREKKSLGIIILDPARAQNAPVTDAELRREYNANQDRFRTQERVQAKHILVKSDATNDAAMKAKAEGLLKQIQAGGDFAKIAKENSGDPGSAAQGGELGWIVKGQTVPEFEKSAFSLKPGETSGLVKTTYGYHIIQVEAHEQARLQALDEVKAQLTGEINQRKGNEQLQAKADKAIAELRKDPAHPDKATAAVDGDLFTATNVASGDPYPGIGVSKEFNDAVAALKKGEVTAGPVVLQGNRVAIASVLDVQAARQSTYEEARAQARTRAGEIKLAGIVDKKATDLAAKVKELNGDLEKAAKSMALEVKTSTDIDRQGAVEGVGQASLFEESFNKPENTVVGPITSGANKVMAKTLTKTSADPAGIAPLSAGIRTDLKQKKETERQQLFEDGLKKRLEQEGKLKVRQDLVMGLVRQYTRS